MLCILRRPLLLLAWPLGGARCIWGAGGSGTLSDVGVLVEFGGAEGKTCIGGRGDVGVWWKEGLVLALVVDGGRGQQPVVDAHGHLVDNATRVGDAVSGL